MHLLRTPARLALVGAALAVFAIAAPNAARAQDKGAAAHSMVIIVLDTDRVGRESVVGKGVDAEAQKYGKALDDENRKDEAALQSAAQDLQRQRGTLPEDQFATKARALDQRSQEVQRMVLRRRQAFEKSFNAAILKVRQAIVDAARDVATAHNADVVMQSQALLFYNTGWDVTNEVLALVNKRVTQVEFVPPKVEPEGPGQTQSNSPEPTSKKKEPKQQ